MQIKISAILLYIIYMQIKISAILLYIIYESQGLLWVSFGVKSGGWVGVKSGGDDMMGR